MHIKREFKPETWAMAERITKNLRGSLLINGKNPKSIAAGIIYTSSIICGDNVTQQELSRNMGVTTETIRKSYKLIKIDMKL
jgi:transcription initiation factor TFIIIB Brf1 subunit/transcription initiation factor TFIIB